MNNKDYKYDKKINRLYNYLLYTNFIIAIIVSVPLIDLLANIINIFIKIDKITDNSSQFHSFIIIALVIFVVNIFIMKKFKLSNCKYYTFKLNKKVYINKIENNLNVVNNRCIVLDEVSLKRVKFKKRDFRKYRLLCYKKDNFEKNN